MISLAGSLEFFNTLLPGFGYNGMPQSPNNVRHVVIYQTTFAPQNIGGFVYNGMPVNARE